MVLASLSCLLLAVGCNVYDASLLQGPLTDADSGAGGALVAGAGGTHSGGAVDTAGDGPIGDAGSAGSTAGSDNVGGAGGVSAGSGGVAVGGAGASGGPGIGGGSVGGATNAALSMIDDMETPDQYIPLTDSRVGFWTLTTDSTAGGKKTPSPVVVMAAIPGGRADSLNGLHTTTSGFATRPVLNVELNRKGSARNTYDASAYKAVHFWAKVETGSGTGLHFAILDQHTDPGGALCCPTDKCTTGNMANGLCYDHFADELKLTSAWAEYTVDFAKLNQIGWGENNVTELDAAHVFALQMDWDITAMDLWIDDIAFVKK